MNTPTPPLTLSLDESSTRLCQHIDDAHDFAATFNQYTSHGVSMIVSDLVTKDRFRVTVQRLED